ncbi:ABC transporter substrate-binding protein [Filobacillus milosensis]|nr:ABC transporter substrate-binding protein [Filobacillus milosensis]
MKEHYFTLFNKWGCDAKDIYITEIANELDCSVRHTKTIIKKLSEKEWINWSPNPGRGKASTIKLLKKPKEIEEQEVQNWIKQGNISKALRWMENQSNLETPFVQWLENQFHWTPAHKHNKGLDVLSYPYYYTMNSLIPWETTTRHESHIAEHIYNRLVDYNFESQSFIPELAHDWEASSNGRVWRIYLRKGIYFHNGEPLTSHTIKENVLMWKHKQSANWKQDMVKGITDINTPTINIVEFKLSKPNQLFLHLFTGYKASIIPVQTYKQNPEAFRMLPVGTGPYRMIKHEEGHLILEAFDHYYGFRPMLDQIELYSIPKRPNHSRRQVYYRIVNNDTNKVKTLDWFRPSMGGVYLTINHQKPGLHRHPDFPEMLSKALDRTKLFKEHPSHDVWFPDSFFNENSGVLRQSSDTQKAKEWFKKQGFEGEKLTLTSTCLSHNAYFKYELTALKEVFKDIGIHLETKVVDIKELANKRNLRQTDIIIAGMELGEDRLVSLMNAFTSPNSFILNTVPTDVRVHIESMLETVWNSPNTEVACHNLRIVEEYLLDHYYMIFLYQRKYHICIEADERLQGVEVNLNTRLRYHKLWYKS